MSALVPDITFAFKTGKRRKGPKFSSLMDKSSQKPTLRFPFHSVGQNCVTWLPQVPKEAGKELTSSGKVLPWLFQFAHDSALGRAGGSMTSLIFTWTQNDVLLVQRGEMVMVGGEHVCSSQRTVPPTVCFAVPYFLLGVRRRGTPTLRVDHDGWRVFVGS